MKDEEDEAWDELERAQRRKMESDKLYEAGWNSALEMAAFKLTHEFRSAFGADTLASIAVYIKGMKK